MAKAKKIKSKAAPKKLNLPSDTPVHLDMPFDDAVRLALNTPSKKKIKDK